MSFIGKSVAALAVAIALVFIVNAMGDIYNPVRTLDEPVYLAGLDTGDGGGGTQASAAKAEEEPEADIFTLIAEADASAGKATFRQCAACHTAEIGGPNRVGPNLGNVVGADIASHEGFNYSDALAGKGGQWSYENLNAWLENPKNFAPGNKMTFAGLRNAKDRAAVIKFLMSNTENPPEVPVPQAAAEEAPAGDEGEPVASEEAPAEDEGDSAAVEEPAVEDDGESTAAEETAGTAPAEGEQ